MALNITLDPDVAAFVQSRIAPGHYDDVDDVINNELRMLASAEAIDAGLDEGLADLDAGRFVSLDQAFHHVHLAIGKAAGASIEVNVVVSARAQRHSTLRSRFTLHKTTCSELARFADMLRAKALEIGDNPSAFPIFSKRPTGTGEEACGRPIRHLLPDRVRHGRHH